MIPTWRLCHAGSTHLPRSGRRHPLPGGDVVQDRSGRGRWVRDVACCRWIAKMEWGGRK